MQLLSGKIRTSRNGVTSTDPTLTDSNIRGIEMAKTSLPNSNSTFKICSVDRCNAPVCARGWCTRHYWRWSRYGSVTTPRRGWDEPLHIRFWLRSNVTANPAKCWLWQGTVLSTGYGQFKVNTRTWLAHRYAWFLHTGKVSKLFLLHSCDTPRCVNPNHLREGTQADNMRDKVERGRQFIPNGESHPSHILTERDVMVIRQRLKGGEKQAEIAKSFNVSQSTITSIKKGRAWAWLKEK